MPPTITPNKYTVIHEQKLEGFKALKRFEYSYPTQVVKIVVTRYNNTKTRRFDLKIHPTTKLKELEEIYNKIT